MNDGEEFPQVYRPLRKGTHVEDLRSRLGIHPAVFEDPRVPGAGSVDTDAVLNGNANQRVGAGHLFRTVRRLRHVPSRIVIQGPFRQVEGWKSLVNSSFETVDLLFAIGPFVVNPGFSPLPHDVAFVFRHEAKVQRMQTMQTMHAMQTMQNEFPPLQGEGGEGSLINCKGFYKILPIAYCLLPVTYHLPPISPPCQQKK